MARIPYPEEVSDPRAREILARVAPLNLLRLEAHAEGAVEAIIRLSDGVLNRGIVDPAVKIVAFLRLCEVVGSPYEFAQLAKVAAAWDLSPDLVEAARGGSGNQALSPLQGWACRLAEELAVSARCHDDTFRALSAELSPRELCELIIGIGFYLMQSRVIETLQIELETPPVPVMRPQPSPALDAWRNGHG